jgi:hypothetical protein
MRPDYAWQARKPLGEVISLVELRDRLPQKPEVGYLESRLDELRQLGRLLALPRRAVSRALDPALLLHALLFRDYRELVDSGLLLPPPLQLDVPQIIVVKDDNKLSSTAGTVIHGIATLRAAWAAKLPAVPVWWLDSIHSSEPSRTETPVFTPQEHLDDLDFLRSSEGDSVTLLCDNPDGPPDHAIECCGEWTGWSARRFTSREGFSSIPAVVHDAAGWKWRWQQGELSDE